MRRSIIYYLLKPCSTIKPLLKPCSNRSCPRLCRGSVVAIDSAVPRREEGTRTDDDVSTSSMVSLSRGLPSVPSIHSMHSPSRLPPYAPMGQHSAASSAFVDAHDSPSVSFEVQPLHAGPPPFVGLGLVCLTSLFALPLS